MNEKLYQIEMIDDNGCIEYSGVVFESETQAYTVAKNAVLTGNFKGFYIREIYIIKRGE